jgi:hypothetical protein
MTKKHFILLADLLASIESSETREEMMRRVIDVCAKANPRFNPQRFRDYVRDKAKELKIELG